MYFLNLLLLLLLLIRHYQTAPERPWSKGTDKPMTINTQASKQTGHFTILNVYVSD